MTTLTTPALVAQPLHFHAPHKTAAARPPSSQRVWTVSEVAALFDLPFSDLLFQAQTVHRTHFDPNLIELATLLSVKTGGCPEDCGYCPQSVHFDTGVEAGKLMDVEVVREAAERAKAAGATRFCMGAAWRAPKDRDVEAVAELVKVVKATGLEACATLGMLGDGHAETLRDAGLDYYNHNLDSAPDFYGDIITTRDYQDRLDTLARVRLSAGRQSMSEAVQALCFVAGANSIFYGEKLLTTANPDVDADEAMLQRLGLRTGHPVPRD